MPNPTMAPPDPIAVSHNAVGQRLGRKGLETRRRILNAWQRLIDQPADAPVTLSAVAREAEIALPTVYLYFPDLPELVLASLQRLVAAGHALAAEALAARWPDATLDPWCADFVRTYFGYWRAHGRVLHMRNRLSDEGDARFREIRHRATWPLVRLLVMQMDGDADRPDSDTLHLALAVLAGLERIATVTTNPHYRLDRGATITAARCDAIIAAQARLTGVAIRHQRAVLAA